MFQIEVFDAFQTRFGPSKRNPKLKMEKTSLEVLNIICPSSTVHTKIDQSNFIASSHRRARDPPRSQSLGSRMDRRCCYRRDRMGELPEIGLQPCAAPEQRGTEGASGGKSAGAAGAISRFWYDPNNKNLPGPRAAYDGIWMRMWGMIDSEHRS